MAINSTAIFNQTSRTILFEHFSDDDKCFDLARVLSGVDKSGQLNSQNRLELDTLMVHSFDEFLEKFAPPVFEVILPPPTDDEGNITGPPIYHYTLDKKEAAKYPYYTVRYLHKHIYYEMLMQLYKEKCRTLKVDEEFDDAKILEMMTPKHEVKKMERLRQQMFDNQLRRYFGEQKGENVNEYINKYDELVDTVKDVADDTLVMIAQRIDDINVISKVPEAVKNASQMLGSGIAGYLGYDENGHFEYKQKVQVQEVPLLNTEKVNEQKLLESKAIEEIRQDITDEYQSIVPADMQNEFALKTMLKALAPLDGQDIDLPALEEERQGLEAIYKAARDSFAKALCGEVEKLLGVKAFFDHAAGDDGYFEPGLIVTNCTAMRLLEDDVRDTFIPFIKGRGIMQTDNRIWLGILPAISIDKTSTNAGSVDYSGMSHKERKAARAQQQKMQGDVLNLQKGMEMLGILDEAHIMTFCNTRDSRDNEKGYESVTPSYLRDRKNDFVAGNYDHAVYAYPNFSIMRYRKIPVSKNHALSNMTDSNRIELPSVAIDAAYIAAGLMAGSQQAQYLEKHGLAGALNSQNVCVHVNMEDDRIRKNICTHLNLASKDTWIMSEDARGFGMAFCGAPNNIDGKEMKNTYLYSARTLAKNEKGRYRLIYRVMLADFIDAYLRRNSIDDSTKFKKFKQNVVQEWKDELKKNPDVVNYMLNGDEDIELKNAEVFVNFGKDEDRVTFRVAMKEQ